MLTLTFHFRLQAEYINDISIPLWWQLLSFYESKIGKNNTRYHCNSQKLWKKKNNRFLLRYNYNIWQHSIFKKFTKFYFYHQIYHDYQVINRKYLFCWGGVILGKITIIVSGKRMHANLPLIVKTGISLNVISATKQ